MADKTAIEWTDATGNPIAGCSVVSAACTNDWSDCPKDFQAARIDWKVRAEAAEAERDALRAQVATLRKEAWYKRAAEREGNYEVGAGHDELAAAYDAEFRRAPAPSGWKLVPVEPSEALITIGAKAIQQPHGAIARNMAKSAYRAMLAASPEPPVSGWLPIEAAPSAKSVLVAYKNRCDKWRVVKAVRYEQYQNEQPLDDDEGEVGEYCEEKDAYFVRAGWYELIDNWDDFGFVAIYEGDPVAWMNLPDPPKQQEPK